MLDIFDPRRYEGVRRPLLDAESLPPWCYTSDAFYRREVEEILVRSWNLVGRTDEIPNPGDYRVFDLCGRSAIVVRGDDGEIRAFANTCRHRGTRLLDDAGHGRAIICPYHAWTYRLDGTLFGCRGMEKTRGFDKAGNSLAPVRLGTWAGFVFVCFSQDCPDLETWLGDLPEQFSSYRFETFELVRRKHYDLDCNWKLYIENAMEDYHTPTVHKSSIGLQETDLIPTVGEWDSIHMESEGDHRGPAGRHHALPACRGSRGTAGVRDLLHRPLSDDVLRHHPGLHVVAADDTVRPAQVPGDPGLVLPVIDGGAPGLRRSRGEVLQAVGQVDSRRQCDLRAPAGGPRFRRGGPRPPVGARAGSALVRELGAGSDDRPRIEVRRA